MKKLISILLSLAMLFSLLPEGVIPELTVFAEEVSAPEAWGPVPSEAQLYYQKQELSAFFHFGMNTFTGLEWGKGTESPSQFKLESIDTDQWVQIVQDAGFKRIIFTAKHHDGFCNWPSALTEHSVKNSPAQIDVLAELSKSATKYDVDMGVYLSPWDVNNKIYGAEDPIVGKPYNDYYKGQLDEILGDPKYGNDGKFVEVWMDGARASDVDQPYYFTKDYAPEGEQNWWDLIKGHDPDILLFAPFGGDVRWIGNERGFAGVPCWSKINRADQKSYYDRHDGEDKNLVHNGQANGVDWSIPETDVSIVPGWFTPATPKSMKDLAKIYFESVGRGSVLLLNLAAGRDGRVPANQALRVAEFGQAIKNTFKTNLAADATVTATSVRGNSNEFKAANVIDNDYDTYWTMDDEKTTGSIELDLGGNKTFDVISLQEYIPLGQRISKYNVEVYSNGSWQVFGNAADCQTIGYKGLVRSNPVIASKVRVNITASQAVPLINSIGVYKATQDFSLGTISLTTGKTATASSHWNLWEPSKAVDGNKDTRWASNRQESWLEVDLESPTAINKAMISEHGSRINKYQIEYWDEDTSAWKIVNTGTTIGLDKTIAFDEVIARKVRLHILGCSAEPTIWAFELYNDSSEESLTRGKTATASSYHDKWEPSKAVDGDPSTRWACDWGKSWLEVDLGVETTFSKSVVNEHEKRITSYQLEYRNDNSSEWKVISAGTTIGTEKVEVFEPVTARYVRLNILAATAEPTIYLFNLYNESGSVYSLDSNEYNVNDDEGKISVKIMRSGDINTTSQVEIYTMPGTGVHGKNFDHLSKTLTFEPNETQKIVDITVYKDKDDSISKDFYVKIEAVGEQDSVGESNIGIVTIWKAKEHSYTELFVGESVKSECEDWDYAYPAEPGPNAGASGGYYLHYIGITNRGESRAKFWYDAPVAGEYTVQLRYFTGRKLAEPNMIMWQGPDVESGSLVTPNQDNATTKFLSIEFTVNIKKAGKGYIEWYNDNPGTSGANTGMPNLDYMTFTGPVTGSELPIIPIDPSDLDIIRASIDDQNNLEVSMKNNGTEAKGITVLVAAYNQDGILINTASDACQIDVGETKNALVGVTWDTSEYKTAIFIWDNSAFIPYTAKFELSYDR